MQYPDVNIFLRKRYFVGFWACIGIMILGILRSNISIALVEMTYEKTIVLENGTILKRPPLYNWDSKRNGFVISLFNYGFYLAPIGGILALKYGAATVYGFGLAATAVLTAVSPFLLRYHFILFAATRVLEGMSEGIAASALINIFIYWAPPHELSRLLVFSFAGIFLGFFLNYSICGFIAQNWGFEAVFIVTGCGSLIWYVLWFALVSNTPEDDRFITQNEKNYFKNFNPITTKRKKLSYPWKKIITSKPVWALFNEYFCYGWLFSFIGLCFPLYIKDVFNVNVQTVGFIAGIPALAGFVGIMIWSSVADYLRSHQILSRPTLHRIFIFTAQLFNIMFLINIGWWTNFTESVVCFTIMRLLSSAGDVSYQVILIDMFGEYAALLKGMASMFGNTAVILNPIIMGCIITDHSRSSWNTYFLFLSTINIFGLIVLYKFGSGERQEWATPEEKGKIKEYQDAKEVIP